MRKIKVPPYNYLVCLAFGEEELRAILKKKKIDTVVDTDSNLGFVMPLEDVNGVELCLLYLRDPADYVTLVHETMHVIHFMLNAIGIPLDIGNTEVMAYHQGWLIKEITKKVK